MPKIPSQKTCHMKIFLIHVKQSFGTNNMERKDDKQAQCGAVPPNKYAQRSSLGWYAED